MLAKRICVFLAVIALLFSVVLLAAPGVAQAHAEFVRAEPAFGSALASPPANVTIWFSEELAKGSQISVIDQKGRQVDDGNTVLSVTDPKSMSVGLKPVPAGVYLVQWNSISLQDGDAAEGTFTFSVSPSGATGGGSNTQMIILIISIVALLASILALLRSRRRAA